MANKLTPKQEKFVQGLVSGLSQIESYKEAYDTSRMKNSTISARASELAKNSKITERYKHLIKEYSERSLWNRERSFQKVLWLLQETERTIIEAGEVRQSTGTIYLQSIDKLDDLAYRDYELADEKLRLEIESLRQKLESDPEQDDKLVDFANAMKEAFKDG